MSAPTSRLEIVTDDPTVLVLRGDVDSHTAPDLDAALGTIDSATDAELDLSGVVFIDSSGLRVVIAAHQRHEAAGSALRLRQPSESVRRLFEITGLTDHLVIEN